MVNTELLESLRAEKGLTCEDIAFSLGYACRSAYCKKLYNRGSKFTLQDIMKLCKIFNLEPNDLLIH
jgi:DNA-binding Xre family transcriptional regulator